MAGVHFSRGYWLAVCDMRNDAMRDSVLSWPLPRCIKMESTDFHTSVRCNSLRSVRVRNTHDARAASADSYFDKARKYIFACLRYVCDCAKLGLFATALAQLLNGRAFCESRMLSGLTHTPYNTDHHFLRALCVLRG